ncbi:MAG TPA: hypothetical protein DCM68_06860 [Verrucomicrobia bacterium]|nr:hypothetical protein [Verrucomicrobiota bacterium]
MKQMAYWMVAALALCWTLTGCGNSKPAAQEESVAGVPAEAAALDAEAVAAPAPAAEEPAMSEADAAVVVAKVNGTEITEGEIQKVMGLFKKQMGGRIPADQMAEALPRIRERILEELIMRRVMLGEVAKQGVSISDAEFEKIKGELVEELPPGTTLETYMAETGTTEAEMREQMAVRKLVIAKAESLEKPSDEEIQKFYDENKEGFSQGESVTASHILLKVDPADDEAAKAAKKERLEGLRKQLLEGADFAEIAKANSDCPSASAGGELGSFGRGQMVPEFEDAAFSQPVGSVGEVVETQFGLHLIKVTEREEAKTLDFAEVKPRIGDILYSQKQQDAVKEFVDGLRKQATVERFDAPPAEETMLQLDVEDEVAVEAAPAAEEAPVPVEAVAEEVKDAVAEVAVEAPAASEAVVEEAQEAVAEIAVEAPAAAEAVVEEVQEAAVESAVAVEAATEEVQEAAEESVEQAVEAVEEAQEAVEEAVPAAGDKTE